MAGQAPLTGRLSVFLTASAFRGPGTMTKSSPPASSAGQGHDLDALRVVQIRRWVIEGEVAVFPNARTNHVNRGRLQQSGVSVGFSEGIPALAADAVEYGGLDAV